MDSGFYGPVPLAVACWYVRWDTEIKRWAVRHYGQGGGVYAAYAETAEEGKDIAEVMHAEAWNEWYAKYSNGLPYDESVVTKIVDKLLS